MGAIAGLEGGQDGISLDRECFRFLLLGSLANDIVQDALMRQLRKNGWLHHLGRHSVACFLTRGQLYISWERVRHFPLLTATRAYGDPYREPTSLISTWSTGIPL